MKNKIMFAIPCIAGTTLVLFAFTPLSANAKDTWHRDAGGKVEVSVSASSNEEHCWRFPFGHAHGWWKNHATTSRSDECERKWKPATTTPDTTDPHILGVEVKTKKHPTGTAVIRWETDERTIGEIMYGTTTTYGMSATDSDLRRNHKIKLTHLAPGTTYHFKITTRDGAGNDTMTGDSTFMTQPHPDTHAPTMSGIEVVRVSSTTARARWHTNEKVTGKIFYSSTTPLNLLSASMQSTTTLTHAHTFTLTGLSASTTYYYSLESKDAVGNSATSSERSFMTRS